MYIQHQLLLRRNTETTLRMTSRAGQWHRSKIDAPNQNDPPWLTDSITAIHRKRGDDKSPSPTFLAGFGTL
jgi:hypothetical protein